MAELSGSTNLPAPPGDRPPGLRRYLATSQNRFPRLVRAWRRRVQRFSLPAPRFLTKPMAATIVFVRDVYYDLFRLFVCEPFFKAHCGKIGSHVRTGCFLHWITGKGIINVGNNVHIDGKSDFAFAARYSDQPVLEIGDNTGIGHACRFVIGKRVTIGCGCTISGGTIIMDSNGHRADAEARLQQSAPTDEEVRPVTVGDNVWIGMHCIIFPGVRIGAGSVISAGSIVRTHVPPYSVVAGNPARVMFRLKKPEPPAPQTP